MTLAKLLVILCVSGLVYGCGSTSNPVSPSSVSLNSLTFPTPTAAQVQGMYAQFANGVQVTVGDQSVTLRSNGIPDHTSPYFSAGHALYEAPHAGMVINPHSIAEQNYAFQVPTTPSYASPSDTPMGSIGMAVNGVALFNQYAAGRQPLTSEIATFDRYNGHPPRRVTSTTITSSRCGSPPYLEVLWLEFCWTASPSMGLTTAVVKCHRPRRVSRSYVSHGGFSIRDVSLPR